MLEYQPTVDPSVKSRHRRPRTPSFGHAHSAAFRRQEMAESDRAEDYLPAFGEDLHFFRGCRQAATVRRRGLPEFGHPYPGSVGSANSMEGTVVRKSSQRLKIKIISWANMASIRASRFMMSTAETQLAGPPPVV